MNHASHSKQGFTLIEVLVVIAILGILMAVGISNYARWRANSAVMEGAQQFARDVDRTRTSAKRENACWQIKLTSSSNSTSYQLLRFTNTDCSGTANRTQTRSLPTGTRLSFLSGQPEYINFFPPYGTTDSAPNRYEIKWAANSLIKRAVHVSSILGKTVIK
ncbi:pilus assembly FimT family protein [Deinococcus enclensis]|uniref:Prepilin-type N-terminal cleavage/methylation domain-containing protein n=1 Tax=Deinococcus enclensis TaxID=1049582 RepID=A0ABT9MCF3_9DEIO|nr:type II secretion system protein [Deinococcus enclensis]MDP9764285.1 prepilin-type N-terminal cleavage/methylation domain-containing protein [Deinococcus enclensis]